MQYKDFRKGLDKIYLSPGETAREIVKKVLKAPNRYIGNLRVTPAKHKLLQNITQSREIKFGDFLEEIAGKYLLETNFFEVLNKRIKGNLKADQLLRNPKTSEILFIEQKIRDDHDSSKKRGQVGNFIAKIKALHEMYPKDKIKACMWFIDDMFEKNKNFYQDKIEEIKGTLHKDTWLFYGKELFEKLGAVDKWNEMLSYFAQYKEEIKNINIDVDDIIACEEALQALAKVPAKEWDEIRDETTIKGMAVREILKFNEIAAEVEKRRK